MTIRFIIPLPAGLHQKPARPPIVDAIRRATGLAGIPKRFYRTTFEFYGRFEKDGKPTSKDVSNMVSVLFDCMATAACFGKNGKGDGWLQNRGYEVRVTIAAVEQVAITLVPS